MKRADVPRDGSAVVGCYSVDLYCQHPNHQEDYGQRMHAIGGPGDVAEYPTCFIGETRTQVLRTARRAGWWISRGEKQVLCPYHARQVKR